MRRQTLHRLCFALPLLFSLTALGLVACALTFGWAETRPGSDEGTAAHVFQLLIVAQAPLITGYVLTTGNKEAMLRGLVLQALAIAAALAPVFVAGL